MKRFFTIFLSAICLGLSSVANAQSLKEVYLAPDPQTAKWSYIETDSNGKQIATIYYSIESLKGDAMNGNVKLRMNEVPVATPKDSTENFGFYCFKDGEYMLDLRSGFEDFVFEGKIDSLTRVAVREKYPDITKEKEKEVFEKVRSEFYKMSGETRGLPRNPEIGKLPDFEFQCKMNIMSMKITGKDRRVVGKESIETGAGTFDCFIVEEIIATKFMFMKDVEKTKSWYAYGIGLVKEITYDKSGKLISTMTLNEINWQL